MDQLELFDLPNPCLGICQANNRGYCIGCLRSREERFNWHNKPVEERARILKLLAQRRIRLNNKQQKEQQADNSIVSLSLDL